MSEGCQPKPIDPRNVLHIEAGMVWPNIGLVAGLMRLLIDVCNNLRTDAKTAAKDNPLKKPMFDQTDLIRKRLGELGVTLEDPQIVDAS